MGRTRLTLAAVLAFAPVALSAQDSTAAGAEGRVHGQEDEREDEDGLTTRARHDRP